MVSAPRRPHIVQDVLDAQLLVAPRLDQSQRGRDERVATYGVGSGVKCPGHAALSTTDYRFYPEGQAAGLSSGTSRTYVQVPVEQPGGLGGDEGDGVVDFLQSLAPCWRALDGGQPCLGDPKLTRTRCLRGARDVSNVPGGALKNSRRSHAGKSRSCRRTPATPPHR